jgi:hypothetical protein
MSTADLKFKGGGNDPSYKRLTEDEYLRTPKPAWYLEHTRRKPIELSLDLSKLYGTDEFWQVSLVEKDAGMPAFDRHWCFHLVDTFTPSLTSLNLQRCNVGDKGLEEFILVLKVNTSLRNLNLKDNNLSSRQVGLFLDAIEAHNFTLTTIEIDEGKKSVLAKNKYQHDSVSLLSVAGEIMANESEVDVFETLKRRTNRITSFNAKVCKVRTPEIRKKQNPDSLSLSLSLFFFFEPYTQY